MGDSMHTDKLAIARHLPGTLTALDNYAIVCRLLFAVNSIANYSGV